MERFSYPGEAFFNVKMTHLGIDTFLHDHSRFSKKSIGKCLLVSKIFVPLL